MDDYNVREAREDDREEVLGIHNNVYDGLDYLPVYFDYFMSCKDITPFVLLHKNKIIAFVAAHIVDDGDTLVTRAVRLNPKYEGKGLFRYLDNFVAEWAKSKHVTRKAFVSADQNTNIFKPSFRSIYKLLETKNILTYSVDPVTINLTTLDAELKADLLDISDSVLETYFTSDNIRKNLFPNGHVVVDTVPFKILASNIAAIRGPDNSSVVYSDVQMADDKFTGLLSFGTLYKVKQPAFQYTIEIYGNDKDCLRIHLAGHIRRFVKEADGITCLALYIGKHFKTEWIDEILSDYGVSKRIYYNPHSSNLRYKEQYLFEKIL